MTTAAGKRRGWAKPLLFGLLALVVVVGVALINAYQAQGAAYCDSIAEGLEQAEAQGAPLAPHAERLRRQYDEECR